ncbi:MAG: metal ABC transporter permease, partial [Polyangia bacterium]
AGLLVAAIAIAAAGQVPAIGRDTAVAVVVTTLFGAGALMALSPSSPPGLQSLLFGDVLGVSDTDLGLAAGLAVVVLATLGLLHARLLAVGFDRLSATGLGVRPLVVDLVLVGLVALALLVAVQGLGNLLVVAVFVAPASAARLVARRMGPMMAVSAAVAVVAGVGGLYLSYYAGTAAGASIAAMLVAAYLLAGVGRGVVARA